MSGQAARLGFTLAEVLITLGIIGVVAALTLPSLINKYREKQLRTAFMRSSSIIQNALNQTAIEFGYNNIKELNNICGSLPESETGNCRTTNQETFNEINKQFISNFISIKLASNMDFYARQKKLIIILEKQISGMSIYMVVVVVHIISSIICQMVLF